MTPSHGEFTVGTTNSPQPNYDATGVKTPIKIPWKIPGSYTLPSLEEFLFEIYQKTSILNTKKQHGSNGSVEICK